MDCLRRLTHKNDDDEGRDLETLEHWIDLAIAIATGIVGWFVKAVTDRMSQLEARTHSLELNIHTRADAARAREEWKQELRDFMDNMNQQHTRLFDKLDDMDRRAFTQALNSKKET